MESLGYIYGRKTSMEIASLLIPYSYNAIVGSF
jgi:hypothetical protein